jgi:uncharacterized repeat protein (TIGR02543 family)
MSNFGSGSNSNGNFWYGHTTNFPGFLYKKNLGVGGRRSTKMAPGGNTTCNSSTDLYNKYKPGGGGVGASSTANRRAKNRLATICGSSNKCFPCYNTLGQYSNYTHNPNGFVPCPGTINISTPTPSGPYTVTYLGNGSNGGSVPVDGSSPYIAGSNVTVLGNTFTRTGYIFAGWSTNSSGTGSDYNGGDIFTINANTTLYAQWIPIISGDYTLTYNGNGGTGSEPALTTEYEGGASVTILGNSGSPPLSRSGYQFAGWNTAADGSGTNYVGGDAFTMPSQNTTLYAKWIINSSGFRIIYNGNEGSGTAPSSSGTFYPAYSTENIVDNTGSFSNGSLVFAGWNTLANGTGTSYPVGSPITMTQNYTLYAQWIPAGGPYTLTYDAGTGGSGSAPASPTSYSAGLPANILANTGYTNGSLVFNGWNTAADGSGTSYPAGSKITMTSNTTLYAQWGSSPALTVTYNPNPPSGATTSGAVPAGPTQYPTNVQVPILGQGSLITPGYTFLGWQDASGSLYAPGYTFTSKTTTLFAQWAPGSAVKVCGGDANNDFIFYRYPFAQIIASTNTNTITIYTTCLMGSSFSNVGSGAAPEGLMSTTSKMVITPDNITINTNTTYAATNPSYNYVPYNYSKTILNNDFTYWPSGATISGITFPFTPPLPVNSSSPTYSVSNRNCVSGCGLSGSGSGTVSTYITFNFFNQGVTLTYSNGDSTIFLSSPNSSLYTTTRNTSTTWIQTPSSLYPYALITPRSSAALTTVTIIKSSGSEYVYPPLPNYTVEYNGNGATGGSIPVPTYFAPYTATSFPYTVLGNTGSLTKSTAPSTFNGWNDKADGTGISYAGGASYNPTAPGASITLYAQWV